uniref:Kringle domain-containing protein n=1 Tax=Callorhinchus milii TaxID=7868 RepID=A0A4W3H326_CALMI
MLSGEERKRKYCGLVENYCRTTDQEKVPWCYTTDPQKRWEYCSARCYNGNETTYRGTVSTTVSGKHCQRWDSQAPHKHTITPEKFTDQGLIENYCRQPGGEAAPWCYTTDPQTTWETCLISKCEDYNTEIKCYTESSSSIYRGVVSSTVSGKTCQRWDSQKPHKHKFIPENYPGR